MALGALSALVSLLALGCEVLPVGAQANPPAEARTLPLLAKAATKAGSQVAFAARIQAFLSEIPAPEAFSERVCAGAAFAGTFDRRIVRRVTDARHDAKNLLPLKFRELLEAPDIVALRQRGALFDPGDAADGSGAARPSEGTASLLGRLAAREFFGVYHVAEYREPRLIYNLKRNRRQWVKGEVKVWLSIYPARTRTLEAGASGREPPLCQTQIRVESDTEGKPTSRRRAEATREALVLELAERVRLATPEALERIGGGLRFSD